MYTAEYFGKISGYSDSREMSLKSKYEYVKKILEDYKTGKNIYQVTTGTFEDYYNQLSAMGYEDVEELYDEAFAWELRVIVNSSPTNILCEAEKCYGSSTLSSLRWTVSKVLNRQWAIALMSN